MRDLIAKDKGRMFPSLFTDFFNTEKFFPESLLDFNGGSLYPWWRAETLPSVNIIEREKDFLIELAAPGLEKKDFKVEIEKDMVTISAEKEEKKEEKNDGYTRKEFSYNKFCRSFRLPENTKTEKIEAAYKDGILKLEIPKKEVTLGKTIKEVAVK